MSNQIVYSTADRGTIRNTAYRAIFSAPYGKNPESVVTREENNDNKTAYGKVAYRIELLRGAERVGMTLTQYCNRFNIKL